MREFITCENIYCNIFLNFVVLMAILYTYICTHIIYSRGRRHERLDVNPRHKSVSKGRSIFYVNLHVRYEICTL